MSIQLHVSDRSIRALAKLICGNDRDSGGPIAPYRTGPNLVAFFNEFGSNDVYPWGGGLSSRESYTIDRLRNHNGAATLPHVIESALDPRHFLDTDFSVDDAITWLNKYLAYDGVVVRPTPRGCRVTRLGQTTVEVEAPVNVDAASHEYIEEQIEKCRQKMAGGDHSGAITNARTMVEAVLIAVEAKLVANPEAYSGDLPKLYKRVQRSLNLSPGADGLSDPLKQVLSGLTSIVQGLSSLRNSGSDAHATRYRASEHHARVAINSAMTMTDFVLSTYNYQSANGRLSTGE
jgi:hypothetical protein